MPDDAVPPIVTEWVSAKEAGARYDMHPRIVRRFLQREAGPGAHPDGKRPERWPADVVHALMERERVKPRPVLALLTSPSRVTYLLKFSPTGKLEVIPL